MDIEIIGVAGELRQNVEAFLEIKRLADDPELGDEQLQAAFRSAEQDIGRALRPFGYYDPVVTSSLTRSDEGWVARFEIDPGEPVRLVELDVRIDGEGADDAAFSSVVDDAGLALGEPLRHDRYDRLKATLAGTAADRGYFDARFTKTQLLVDRGRQEGRVRLHLETGPRYRFGTVTVEQDFLRSSVVERGITIRPGEPYDAQVLRETEFALYDMGHFALVDVERTPDPDTLEVAITLTLTPTRKHRWTVGGGYSTDTQIYVRGGWENRLANERGHRMGVNLRLSQPKQDLLYRYVIPTGKPAEYLTVFTGLVREERGDTISNRFEIVPVDTRFWGPWQRDVFGILQAEKSEIASLSFNDFYLVPGIRVLRSNWNDLMRPTRGWKATMQLRASAEQIGSTTGFAQIQARTASYIPVAARARLYLRGELGLTAVDDFDALPASQRFFAGGDRSVRGFALNELSPVDEEGNRVGGQYLAFASVEVEYDIRKRWTVDAFVDTGNAFDEFGDPLEYSAGVGFRWRSPIGLIGADIAQPLSEEDRGPRLHFSVRPEL